MKSSVFKKKLGIVLLMLAIITMLGSACGPGQAPPAAPSPPGQGGNQPPTISSLTATHTQVYPSGNTEIRCVASDPDGDKVNFKWSCTGGSFTGVGEIVTWKASENYGSYDVTVTVEDGKGGTTQATLTLSVVANQNPQISSLVADPSTALPKGSSTITCVATDPDGDEVRYSWSASEGNVTGVGNKVTWVAPNKDGTFDITVLVSDGKGGETTGYVSVTVSAARKTVTIPVVQEETGTVSSDGDRDTSKTMAGDDDKNVGYRAFWSFDIWSLVGTEIQDAKLAFTTKSKAGDPFPSTTGLSGLRLWKVNYGRGGLPEFGITGGKMDSVAAVVTKLPTVIDVTPEITHFVKASSDRFQVEALFMKITNGNGVAEWIEWSEVTLEVTYSER
ncbi:MAG TPA: PKD domain-containing protein [Dehalococcoidia bacterium]|nr:PKD domain-containing protein [Dehalococcoidia bacterium]